MPPSAPDNAAAAPATSDSVTVSTGERTDVVGVALRWLPLLLFLGLLGVLVYLASRPLTNPDTYFHLRIGTSFLDGWSMRQPGEISAYSTREWLPTQWLFQVGIALGYRGGGLALVAWMAGALYVAYAATLYFGARRFGPASVAVFASVLAVFGSANGLSARGQVISYILVVIVTVAWLRTSDDGKARWWLIPLTWIWALAHGMWPIGIAIGIAALIGIALDRNLTRPQLGRNGAVVIGTIIAAAITPIGPGLYGAVLLVGSRGKQFTEWKPNDFTQPIPALVALMLGLLVLIVLRTDARVRWSEAALIVMAGGALLYSNRTLPIAAAMSALLLARVIGRSLPWRPPTRVEIGVIVGGCVASLACLGVVQATTDAAQPDQPEFLHAALSDLPDGTGVLTDALWGGYLLWFYPGLEPLQHGYGDAFTDEEFARMAALGAMSYGWDRELADSGVRWALLTDDSPLGAELQVRFGWQRVDGDDELQLLEAPSDWPDSATLTPSLPDQDDSGG